MHALIFALSLLVANSALATPPQLISLKAQFQKFVTDAQGKDFETQVAIWKSDIEAALPDVYAEMMKSSDKSPDEVRATQAKKWFPFLLEHSAGILIQFDNFEAYAFPKALALAANYPDVDFSEVRVVAMPALMSFNGKEGDINNRPVALFGMDFLEMTKVNPKVISGAELLNDSPVLLAHEFTHVLHMKVSDFVGDDESILDSLWREGIAQMHSQLLVPGTNMRMMLMEGSIANICDSQHVQKWAKEFSADLREKTIAQGYPKWFLMNSDWKSLGAPRAGYCLGYHAVLAAMREHSFNELIRAPKAQVYDWLKPILAKMAQ